MNTFHRKIIGIDFDDVLFDFNRAYVDHHNRLYGTDMTRDRITDYMMEKVWNMPIEDIFPRIETFYRSSDHDAVLPIDGSVQALSRISQVHTVIIVTSRPDFMKESTLRWLDTHFKGCIHDIHFTNQFMGDESKKRTKASVCKEIGVEVFIEDAPIYARNISSAGIPVLLMDAPWNKDVTGNLIHRVNSWQDVEHRLHVGFDLSTDLL